MSARKTVGVKPLDIVRTPGGGIAIVTEVGERGDSSISYLQGCNPQHEYNAWWNPSRLEVLDSIPRLLADAMAHPFGSNKDQGDRFFPKCRATGKPSQE